MKIDYELFASYPVNISILIEKLWIMCFHSQMGLWEQLRQPFYFTDGETFFQKSSEIV